MTVGPATDLEVAVEDLVDATVVRAAGELDVYTMPILREALSQLDLDGGITLRLDLSELRFLDSTGIGTLVSTAKRVRAAGGHFFTICPTGIVRQVLETTGLVEYLQIVWVATTADVEDKAG